MAEFLEWSDWEFKITRINMLRALISTTIQEQMDNVSTEIEMLRKIIKKKC